MNDRQTVKLVIVFLGTIALVLSVGVLWLVRGIVTTSAGSATAMDSAAVAAVGSVTTLCGTAVGGLVAMLVSTGSADPKKIAAEAKAEQAADLASLVEP